MADYVNTPFSEVTACKALSPGHPVFLLLVHDNNNLDDTPVVIKREVLIGQNAAGVGHNLKMMKAVDPNAASKLLDSNELQAVSDFLANPPTLNGAVPQDIIQLRNVVGLGTTKGVWVKMHKAPGIMNLNGAVQELINNNNKTGVRAIAAALNAPGGFEALGQIVAVDLYNQNLDRFLPSHLDAATAPNIRKGNQPNGTPKERFKVLCNVDNVLLAVKDGALRPVGLDSFDPNSHYFANASQTVEQAEAKHGEDWLGRLLAPGSVQARGTYAKEIYEDLENALGPRNRSLAARVVRLSNKRLDKNGPIRILAGMDMAAVKLRTKLNQLIQKNANNAPFRAGLQSRLDIIS